MNSNLFANIADKKLIINNNTSHKGIVTIYDLKGIELINQSYPANQKFVIDLALQEGIYLYKLVNSDGTTFSSKVGLK